MSESLARLGTSDRGIFDEDTVDGETGLAIVPHDLAAPGDMRKVAPYRPPVPGRSWRSLGRFMVLVGGSGVIGVGVAAGFVTLPAAAFFAVGLATTQVLAQTWRQNRLGQSVVGGISLGDLAAARASAEKALRESPSGVMRTLAASNLASVLIQQDLVKEAATVLDRHPPGFMHMPLTTVLWLNNRAFAHLAFTMDAVFSSSNDDHDAINETAAADALLQEAERRLHKASVRDLGGHHNARKLSSALAGTRAIERALQKDGKGALQSLKRAAELDDGPATSFRTAERELCRTEALRLLGRKDEATITLESLTDQPMTERQLRRHKHLAQALGLT